MRKLLLILTVLKLTHSHAQFSAGAEGITIKAGTEVSFENLSLLPSSDLVIENNTLEMSPIALSGSPNGSINRVYRFGTALNFSGVAAISYLPGELNGNTESSLQILYALDESQGFTVTSGSTVDMALQKVSNVLSDINLTVFSASGPISPLPVRLVRFSVSSEGRTAVLKWSTSEEINADRFEIERSLDAKKWTRIGEKSAVATAGTVQNYTFTDADVADKMYYYRLKMIDRGQSGSDGNFAYSQIRNVRFSLPDSPVVFPNPVLDKLSIHNIPTGEGMTVSIYGITGLLHFEGTLSSGESLQTKSLAPGIYVLKMKPAGGRQSTHTFVKQ